MRGPCAVPGPSSRQSDPPGSRKPLCPPPCPRHTVGTLSCGSIGVRPPPCPHRPVSRTTIRFGRGSANKILCSIGLTLRAYRDGLLRTSASSRQSRMLRTPAAKTRRNAEKGGRGYGKRQGGRKCRNVPAPPHLNGMARKTERKKCFSTLVHALKIFGCQ